MNKSAIDVISFLPNEAKKTFSLVNINETLLHYCRTLTTHVPLLCFALIAVCFFFYLQINMSNTNTIKELKLHSPAGVEPAIFTWPLIEQQTAKKDGGFVAGDEIVKTIRLVFEGR